MVHSKNKTEWCKEAMMAENFGYKAGEGVKAFQMDGYYVWDCSVIQSGGKYDMFSSRWMK